MTHNIIETENYLLLVSDEINFAHLPLNNSPVLEGVPLLPPLEDEAESLSLKSVNKRGYTTDDYQDGFEDGYNKAKEKYKYTEEDLMEAMLQISEYYADNLNKDLDGHKKSLDIIQSLQQPKMPVAFECEIETTSYADDAWASDGGYYTKRYSVTEPKTTTNSQGQTVLVGKYIY